MLYILVCIIVVQVDHPPIVFPQRESNSDKSYTYLPEKSVPARTRPCSPPVCHLLCGVLFANESAPAFHMRLQKPMNFDHRIIIFLNLTGVFILAMILTWRGQVTTHAILQDKQICCEFKFTTNAKWILTILC